MKAFLLTHYILTILVLCSNSYSQVSQEWVARYNTPGNNNDEGSSITVDALGNVYVTGFSPGIENNLDFVTLKYNSSGSQQWIQRYNGTGNNVDRASSIAVDLSGNVYVTGSSIGNGTLNDYATIKYNSVGVEQWVQRYNGPVNGDDRASSIAVDILGNVYVTGWSSAGTLFDDYTTVKYNSSGIQQWVQRYNGPGNNVDIAFSIVIDLPGNIYVTGMSAGNGTLSDYATIKYNSSGDSLWVQRYNGTINDYDEASSITVDISGNVYVTGRSNGSNGIDTSVDYTTIKYNSSGSQLWVQRYDGPANSHDEASAIAVDPSGNVYVTGWSIGTGTSGDYATVKYNSAGIQQWVQRYNEPGSGVDIAHSIAIDGSGNVYVTGESMGSGTGVYDYATLKYNSAGNQQWVQRYNGPGNSQDGAYSIVVDPAGNVYVTGSSVGNGTNLDIATIKYTQTIGITPISNEVPKDFRLEQNYPNPFNPSTKIRFAISGTSVAQTFLSVYDVLGREVATLVNEQLQAGTYEVEWDASNYPSGVYYYRIAIHSDKLAAHRGGSSTGEYTETRKAVLIK